MHVMALKRRFFTCTGFFPLQAWQFRRTMEKQLNSLQYGRAFAASAVVAHHSMLAAAQFVERPPSIVEEIVNRGYLGVDFFFVLSGFIILHAHLKDSSGVNAAGKYITKRLRRIYIPYLPVSIALIALYFMLPSISHGSRDWSLLTSLTLIPTERPPALPVAWTLIHEMTFYLIFCLSYFTRHFVLAVAVWTISIVATWAIGWKSNISAFTYILSPQNLEFIVGMASAYSFSKLSPKWCLPLIGFGLTGILGYIALGASEPYAVDRVWFGVSLGPIVLGAAMLERVKASTPVPWLLLVGNASYAIYLVHNPVVSLAIRLGAMLNASWELAFIICVLSGLLAGWAYHIFVETPGLRLAGRLRLPSLGLPRGPAADRTAIQRVARSLLDRGSDVAKVP
jgi:peptidoglycan/LPS O-acetylase OafA/YrhL